jgi:FtsP/CotA-like multicopper oxidase with cupredoxin domain
VIIITDWLDDTILSKFLSYHHGTRNDKPNSILVNGKGVRKGFPSVNKTAHTPRAFFSVKKGSSYRFRLINAGVLFCPIQISIDGHKLKIISVDGKPIEPEIVDAIVLQSTERVDFVLDAYHQSGNYWIKFKGLADCAVNQVYELGILNYANVAAKEPFKKIQNYQSIKVSGRVCISFKLNQETSAISEQAYLFFEAS